MRIIGGQHKGLRFHPPAGLPVRPTTDMAKEALFNILDYRLEYNGLDTLDLFSGTGGISLELASRGAASVTAVDQHFACVRFLSDAAKKIGISTIRTVKSDVFRFLSYNQQSFGFIFADPPFDLDKLPLIPALVMEKDLLLPGGIFVMEFPSNRQLPDSPSPLELRRYGHSSFAIYKK